MLLVLWREGGFKIHAALSPLFHLFDLTKLFPRFFGELVD